MESLDVGITLIVGIVEDGSPYLVGIVFLNAQDVFFVVVVQVEVRQVTITVLQDDEYLVVVQEFTEELPVLVVVQTVHVGIPPYFPSSERGVAVTLQADTVYRVFGKQVSLRSAPFDDDFREILVEEYLLQLGVGVESYLDNLCFTIGISGEIHHFRAWRTLREVVLLVACHAGHVEALDKAVAFLSVTIDDIIDGS